MNELIRRMDDYPHESTDQHGPSASRATTGTEGPPLWVERSDTDKCIHHLFEVQAERTPDAAALAFADQQLSYRELNRRANRVARYLKKFGVGPEVLVGICTERSLDMIVGLLGILKAGGAYVPLDPACPKARLASMLRDIGGRVLLTQQKLMAGLFEDPASDPISSIDSTGRKARASSADGPSLDPRLKMVCLDADWERIARESDENPRTTAAPENLAYVIFTSGSTGKPKGVTIEHRQILNYVLGISDLCSLQAGLNFALVQPLFVDSSQTVLFPALASGGCLHIISEDAALDPQALKHYFSRHGVDFLKIAPSHLAAVLASPHLERVFPRRWLVVGGEASRQDWIEKFRALAPCAILNHYGPTETTVGVLTYPVGRRHVDENGHSLPTVPIGRPLPYTQAHLLDETLQPVLFGAPGELHISGRCLARGYLGRPDLTAEKFVPNPFSDEPGARLYKTGDIARYLRDGNIQFLGRTDHQVKILGFRIELGEIESALAQHPHVREVLVVAREEITEEHAAENLKSKTFTEPSRSVENLKSDKRLVAYVVSDEDASVSLHELRSFLKQKLPDYMVPSAFVLLRALPLTPHGKVDRLALPEPLRTDSNRELPFAAARTPIEEALAAIWSDVLGVEKVGIHDNFFDLGGHSLKAVRIISAVREAFQVEVSLRKLFEAPTVAAFGGYIEAAARTARGPNFASIERIPRDADLPLSFSQERAWFIQQLSPGNLAYNSQVALRLTGPLDTAALERSLNEIVRRHEIYRTTFPTLNGRPVEVIHQPKPVHLPVLDLETLPKSLRETESRRLTGQELRKPFDLTELPLVRWTLLRLGAEEHLLIHVEHHLVHDGWSVHVFLTELMDLYKAFSVGAPSPLPELPFQFADYAHWQRQWMQGQEAEEQLAYWRTKLAAAPPILELPTDRPRPAAQSFRGAQQKFEISPSFWESLRARSRREGTTPFMTMLTAFVVLLYRYSGRDDICVGSGVANRRSRQTEGLIGMIINNLVLRTDLSGDPTFRELLGRVRKVAMEAYGYQDLPFDKVVEALRPKRDLSHNPLFQVMFSFQDTPLPDLESPGLTVSLVRPLSNGSAKFDLNVVIYPPSEQRAGPRRKAASENTIVMWEYSTDLFDDATIIRMMEHYQTVLKGIVADPEQCISRAPLLTEAERRRLLVEWNDTRRDYLKDKCVHEIVEARVERSPEATAVVSQNERLTYRELNTRANRLAHYLRKFGVGPERLVGLCVERSLDMMVGILGILKAGGAYLPLDPAYPEERLEFMLKDAGVNVVLTQRKVLEQLPGALIQNRQSKIRNCKVLCLDTDWEDIAQESPENPQSEAGADNLAYVIYTSGSTGTPKGVEVLHRGISRLLLGVEYVTLDANQAFLQLAPISFDASTFEIWGALLHGAKCVLSPGSFISPGELGEILDKHNITTLWLTASLFNTVIDQAPEALSGVRQLMIGGEALSVPHVRKALSLLPETEITNGYGPTESTTFACCHSIPRDIADAVTSIPIGRAIANTEVYLLDRHLQPVPIGVSGEVYIGGDGLARGYLNRPELTAEKFIPHPFNCEPGARLYRTGDLARHLPNGEIEFVGRMDHQVKIRGYRIEPGEIEITLARHPAVRQTVVLVRRDPSGDERLLAYVVPSDGQAPSASGLREFLKSKLPDYMLPSSCVVLDALPLTPNGKVDRDALPDPEGAAVDRTHPFVAPRSSIERELARIWAEVLSLDGVGIHDNFFQLGGHSLKATQVIARLQSAFNVELPVRALFQNPTVQELALVIIELQAERAAKETITGLFAEVESLSDEDAQRLVSKDSDSLP